MVATEKPGARVEMTIKTGDGSTVKVAGTVSRDAAFALSQKLMDENTAWRKRTTLEVLA